ncbi:MAG: putative DNA binding domain-containing protein [Bacteroidales bacterium]|nr:putative DNA binding domain-containing protein [Bacteroidales bacterium]
MDNTFIIDNLLRQNKSDSLEFRKSMTKDSIAKAVTIMLNTHGGDILVGVDANKNVVGLKSQVNVDRLLNDLTFDIQPAAPIDIQSIVYQEKNLLLIRVWEGTQKPYSYKGIIYQREGQGSASGMNQLIADRKTADANWERMPVLSASIDDLDLEEVRKTMELYRQSTSRISADEESFLTETGLIQNGNLTNACIVLYAKNPMRFVVQSGIKLSVFSSESASDLIDSQNYEGNVFKNVDAIFQFIDNCYSKVVKIDGLLRTERWNYPRIAVREGIMNAIVHRDYNSYQGFLQISVYPNHLDIANYGVTEPILTFIEFGNSPYSLLRNPDIAFHCYYRRLIEMRGTGIPRMLADCKSNGFAIPSFTITGQIVKVSFLQVQLQRKNDDSARLQKLLNTYFPDISLNVKQKMLSVLKEIETQPGIKSNEIGNATGMPKKSIDRYLAELKRVGVISYKGSRKSGGLYIDEQIMK